MKSQGFSFEVSLGLLRFVLLGPNHTGDEYDMIGHINKLYKSVLGP
jgi:hypothetical protein